MVQYHYNYAEECIADSYDYSGELLNDVIKDDAINFRFMWITFTL